METTGYRSFAPTNAGTNSGIPWVFINLYKVIIIDNNFLTMFTMLTSFYNVHNVHLISPSLRNSWKTAIGGSKEISSSLWLQMKEGSGVTSLQLT